MLKASVVSITATALIILISLAVVSSNGQQLTCFACEENGVVNKAPCEAFTVKIALKNAGKTEGTWFVNFAFEGESWACNGTPKTITLKPCESKTLTWNGTVPCDAPAGSIARLIVYYNDSFTPLNWWIYVVSNAELRVTSSQVL